MIRFFAVKDAVKQKHIPTGLHQKTAAHSMSKNGCYPNIESVHATASDMTRGDERTSQNGLSKDMHANDTRTKRPLVVIVGAGSKHGGSVTNTSRDSDNPDSNENRWGLGGGLPLPFAAKGYDIALMGRRMEVLFDIKTAVEAVHQNNGHGGTSMVQCVPCDVTDDKSVEKAFDSITNVAAGDTTYYIDLVIFNVAPPYPRNFRFEGWGDVLLPHQIDTSDMNLQVDTQVNGLIRISRQVMPGMIERRRGCILLSGESCTNLHGGFEFGSVSPARAALRSLAQSMFQAYGPMGVHVCNINIGGIIDSPKTRQWASCDGRMELVKPEEIAEQFLNTYLQKRTVWSYEINLTPSFAARKVNMRM